MGVLRGAVDGRPAGAVVAQRDLLLAGNVHQIDEVVADFLAAALAGLQMDGRFLALAVADEPAPLPVTDEVRIGQLLLLRLFRH